MSTTMVRTGPGGALLRRLSQASAAIGGVLLVTIALLTLTSVLGRSLFSHPIQGDVEVVQLATAVAIACFLPYTQWQGANIIVDFFTTHASQATQGKFDALGAFLLGLVALLVGWRAAAGGMMARDNEETSMLMAIPLWIPYLLMLPGLFLTALVSFYIAWQQLTGRSTHE